MVTATAIISATVTDGGIDALLPSAPSATPSSPKPTMRPAWKVRLTRNAALRAAVPLAVERPAALAEMARMMPPTIAMHVDTPAARPSARTSSSPPVLRSPNRPARSPAPTNQTSTATRTAATPALRQTTGSRLSHDEPPSRYPQATIASSMDARLAWLVVMRLALPLRAEALAETTPGNADKALAIRRSQAVHVIPATARVMSCFVPRLSGLVTVMSLRTPADPWPTPPGMSVQSSCRTALMGHERA